MSEFQNDKLQIGEELFARALGHVALARLKEEQVINDVAKKVHTEALQILEEIQAVLDDSSMDDPECFLRIDRIVEIFHSRGLSTSRHDWE